MKINTYEIKFTGRKVGAIGVFHPITAQVFGPSEEAAILALYDRWEHIQHPVVKVIESPFDAEDLVMATRNEASDMAEIERHVRAIQHVIGRRADKVAAWHKEWHDADWDADHGLFHAHAEQQYPASVRMVAAAECALYFMRETPAGLEVFDQLLLQDKKAEVTA